MKTRSSSRLPLSGFWFWTPANSSCLICAPLPTFMFSAPGTLEDAHLRNLPMAFFWSSSACTSAARKCSLHSTNVCCQCAVSLLTLSGVSLQLNHQRCSVIIANWSGVFSLCCQSVLQECEGLIDSLHYVCAYTASQNRLCKFTAQHNS